MRIHPANTNQQGITIGGSSVFTGVLKYVDGAFADREAEIVQEIEVCVFVDDECYCTVNCSPWGIRECVIGFLFFQGVVGSQRDVRSYTFDPGTHTVHVETRAVSASLQKGTRAYRHTECMGRSSLCEESIDPIAHSIHIEVEQINRLIDELECDCRLFRRTGGVHSAALATCEGMLFRQEDVSRQSALDKLVGYCLMHDIDTRGKILLFSGRMPQSIVARAVKLGCSLVISPGAPTDLSVRLADRQGVTLIGFAKDGCFNVYSHLERLTSGDYHALEVG